MIIHRESGFVNDFAVYFSFFIKFYKRLCAITQFLIPPANRKQTLRFVQGTYTAYELGDQRPAANVHNGSGSPGTEVSDEVTSRKLEDGYGIVDKDNLIL